MPRRPTMSLSWLLMTAAARPDDTRRRRQTRSVGIASVPESGARAACPARNAPKTHTGYGCSQARRTDSAGPTGAFSLADTTELRRTHSSALIHSDIPSVILHGEMCRMRGSWGGAEVSVTAASRRSLPSVTAASPAAPDSVSARAVHACGEAGRGRRPVRARTGPAGHRRRRRRQQAAGHASPFGSTRAEYRRQSAWPGTSHAAVFPREAAVFHTPPLRLQRYSGPSRSHFRL